MSVAGRVRALIEPGWPHDYREFAKHTGFWFDPYPPTFFVGDLERIKRGFVLSVGMNPHVRDSDHEERQALEGPFETYWQSRIGYFKGEEAKPYLRHFRPHAGFVAGLQGLHVPEKHDDSGVQELLANVIHVDLCPLSSRHAPPRGVLLRSQMAGASNLMSIAARVLEEVARAGPSCVLVRYAATFSRLHRFCGAGEHLVRFGSVRLPVFVLPGQAVSIESAHAVGMRAHREVERAKPSGRC